jgi:hypothetical protein
VRMDRVVEIITPRERRRRWRVEEKLRIVAERQEAGTRVSFSASGDATCKSGALSDDSEDRPQGPSLTVNALSDRYRNTKALI